MHCIKRTLCLTTLLIACPSFALPSQGGGLAAATAALTRAPITLSKPLPAAWVHSNESVPASWYQTEKMVPRPLIALVFDAKWPARQVEASLHAACPRCGMTRADIVAAARHFCAELLQHAAEADADTFAQVLGVWDRAGRRVGWRCVGCCCSKQGWMLLGMGRAVQVRGWCGGKGFTGRVLDGCGVVLRGRQGASRNWQATEVKCLCASARGRGECAGGFCGLWYTRCKCAGLLAGHNVKLHVW